MMVNILSSICIWWILFDTLKSFFFPKESDTTAKSKEEKNPFFTAKIKRVMIFALLIRLLFFIYGFVMTISWYSNQGDSEIKALEVFSTGDGIRYEMIAKSGYSAYMPGETELRNLCFYPLYPFLMRIVNVFVGNMQLAGILISVICFCVAMTLLYKIVEEDYGEKIAQTAVILISLAPHSFFYGYVMTESLFLMLTLLAWLFIKKRRWGIAAFCGMLSALTRNFGVLIVIPYCLALWKEYREIWKQKEYRKAIQGFIFNGMWLGLILIAVGVYLGINYYYGGSCFKFMEFQTGFWRHRPCYFGSGIQGMLQELFSEDMPKRMLYVSRIPNVLNIFFFLGLLLVSFKEHKEDYVLYATIYFMICTSDLSQMSLSRFMVVLFPIFIFLAKKVSHNKVYFYSVIAVEIIFGMYLYSLKLLGFKIF